MDNSGSRYVEVIGEDMPGVKMLHKFGRWKNPLRRGEADIILSLGPMTDGFYYTSPIHSMTFHGLLKATSRNAEYWSLFDPFHWRLWLAI